MCVRGRTTTPPRGVITKVAAHVRVHVETTTTTWEWTDEGFVSGMGVLVDGEAARPVEGLAADITDVTSVIVARARTIAGAERHP